MELTFVKSLFEKQQTHEEWVEEAADFFRQLGFFENQNKISTSALALKLIKLQEQYEEVPFRSFEKTADFDLVSWDKRRSWFVDEGALVLPGNEAYIQALQELSVISRKLFSPTSIKETWQGEEGPVTVEFVHKRKKYIFCPRYVDTYFDYGIFTYLNALLEHTKFRFELCGDVLENPVVIVLHEEEKELLKVKRNWKFADL